MISSAILHGADLITVRLPTPLTIAAFVALGGLTGTRFANTDPRLLLHLASAALGAFAVGTAIAMAFAVVAAFVLSLGMADTVIAYAPGAIDAMMILALALHLDPVFIGAHHVARLLLVLVTMPLVVGFMRRMRGKEPSRDEPAP
jgi:membrane AbrB-like protein